MDLREVKEFFSDSFKYIIVVVITLFFVIYVATFQQVVGPSMENTLNDGDVLILNKGLYKFSSKERFDIVSVKYVDTKYLIKRIIGLPGDNIYYEDNVLYVNGERVDEPFLNGAKTNDFSLASLGYSRIPDDMYLVLGDNRGNSLDSRKIGLVKESDIIGKVIVRIMPFNKIKFY